MDTRTIQTLFESSEHRSLGELKLPGLPADQQKLPLANGAQLTFGQICALAGDYYAIAKKPICLGKDEADRKDRFLNAYCTLAFSKRKKIRKILGIIDEQTKAINDAMSQGKPEYVGVQHYKLKEVLKALIYTKFKIISIYLSGLDHMNDNALLAHHAGHLLAMEAAARAHYIDDPLQRQLQLAYAYSLEAFACHFLTDHFASGHLRAPSSSLYFEFGTIVSGLFITFMHNEDNNIGLHVENENGDAWQTFGDAHLFESYNKKTRELAIKALNIVIDDVYGAYQTGQIPKNTYTDAYKLLPKPTANNFRPLFIDDTNSISILYRSDLDDIHCNQYKKLKGIKVPYVLLHFAVRFIKDNLAARKDETPKSAEIVDETTKSKKRSRISKHFSIFHHSKKHTNPSTSNSNDTQNTLNRFVS